MAADLLDFRSASGLLALQSLPRVGPVTALRTALQAPLRATLAERFDGATLVEAFARADERVHDYEQSGVELLTFFDPRYPDRLRQIADPPPVLYVRGNADLLTRTRHVAVVGTREPTTFGRTAAQSLTEALTREGYGIVSGLAKGIDTVAHQTAVDAGGPTIAVMGGGLDRVYPAENNDLAAAIVSGGGALISEQPFGVPPRPNHLIARDRLQSALGVAVVVGQCGTKSGTMHTVRFAASQGRPVFCPVPHKDSEASEGLRVLLGVPANELWRQLPAWKSAQKMSSRLGSQPLAWPVSRERLGDFLGAIEHSAAAPMWERDDSSLLKPPVDH